ncbi:hypothetical protein ASE38_13690 [Cellulomonas sp. Root930]|nr:hypothetical protein ASE38_13690 [Cellulomonas sp. Root930]
MPTGDCPQQREERHIMTTTTLPEAHHQAPQATSSAPGRLGRLTALSFAIGASSALLLTLVAAFRGAPEPVITGSGLIGFALGWALLAVLSSRRTDEPQRWAAVPATVMGVTGIVLAATAPDDAALTTAGWVWAPAMLALAAWTAVRATRSLHSRARAWLVLPTLVSLALVSLGGLVQTVRVTSDSASMPMPGRSVDIGGRTLHLHCSGTGAPTVVLEGGLGEMSSSWSGIADDVSVTSRVCAYDRAGQGWSDDTESSRDALGIAADLHALLERSGEPGPYVLVGHSSGGLYAMTYAAEHPDDVAGMVLLDATNPYLLEASLAGRAGGGSGPLALLPSLARMGLAQLMPSSAGTNLDARAADAFQAFESTARAATNTVDEVSEYARVFPQARTLTTLGSRPLVVVTLADKEATDAAGYAAQQRFSELSTNSALRTADTTHAGLVDDRHGATFSVRAIADVVEAVRAGTVLAQP